MQLETLTAQLERENRIKEGAEKFLKLPITDTMRMQVESELEMATSEIEMLMKRIEQETSKRRKAGAGAITKRKFAGQAPPTNVRLRADSDDKDKDDFRTALNQANSYIKSLTSVPRPVTSPSSPSSTSSGSPASPEQDRTRIDIMNKLVTLLQRNLRVRYEIHVPDLVQAVLSSLADICSERCRAAAYRLIRYSLVDSASIEQLHQQPLDWFIVKCYYIASVPDHVLIFLRSLARDNKFAVEREQVIKLIRAIVDIAAEKRDRRGNTGPVPIPLTEPIIRAFVAVAEHAEDPLRSICVETLAEMSLLDLELVSRAGGIRFLLHALGEGPVELGPILAATFLHIMDSPRTRAYLRLGIDVEIALLAVTDAYGRGPDHSDRMRRCTKVIQLMLRTWSGLMYFCMEDQRAIKSIVDTLRIPSLDSREIVLDMFFDLLNIKAPEWYKTFIDGRRLTMYRKPRELPDHLGEQKAQQRGPEALKLTDQANSAEDAVRRGQRQVEQSKIKLGMQMDDKMFQAYVLETQVKVVYSMDMRGSDPTWSPDHDNKGQYEMEFRYIAGARGRAFPKSQTARGGNQSRKIHAPADGILSSVFTSLFRYAPKTAKSEMDGVRFLLYEDDFLKQIIKSFAQLDPVYPKFNSTPESDPIFSKQRMADTLTFGYFEMLGTLSKHPEGAELMEKSKIFTAFYHLIELRNREDLITAVITNLDYSIDGHPRIVLSKALTSNDIYIRLFATNHLGELIRNSPSPVAWTLRLLLTQLYDPAPEVCEMAIQFLEEACESMEVLELVVEMQPTLDHLGDIGHPLLLRFMSTPTGFRYLYNAGYIDREMDMWFHERNVYYVVQIEIFLAKVFSSEATEDDEDILAFDGVVPPHFYGEMSKTELGCQVLSERGHFAEFSHFIRQHGLESEDLEVILKLKSILWAVGNVGATEGGLPFLEEEEIIPSILAIAEHSLIPSVRGTCFFVLGLISSTLQGAEILDDYRWEATLSPLGHPTGLCIPVDLDKFISLPAWEPVEVKCDAHTRLLPPTVQTELEVITAIENLSNSVIANTASRSLARMKSRPEYRAAFASSIMFFRALHTISTQRYRLPVRRYILDLFNIELDGEVVNAITEAAASLRAPPSFKQSEAHINRVVSMLGLKHPDGESDSDEDDELDGVAEEPLNGKNPVIMLRPVSRIIGFNDNDIAVDRCSRSLDSRHR
ncbi:hypothetical protein ID866_1781 [Astraeus odoratus]|nr:hypothetical protein ID866_1781 [Astraeus odoratus]